jgi:hypothetical protein
LELAITHRPVASFPIHDKLATTLQQLRVYFGSLLIEQLSGEEQWEMFAGERGDGMGVVRLEWAGSGKEVLLMVSEGRKGLVGEILAVEPERWNY